MVAARIDKPTTPSPTGLRGKETFANQQQQDRDTANRQHDQIRVGELSGQPNDPFEEIVPAASYAEQARQLSHDDRQACARLEAYEDTVTDEADEETEFEQPRDEAEYPYRKGCKARYLDVPDRIAAG